MCHRLLIYSLFRVKFQNHSHLHNAGSFTQPLLRILQQFTEGTVAPTKYNSTMKHTFKGKKTETRTRKWEAECVRVTVNFIGTNFQVITSSLSEMLLSAMDITVAINSDCEIEINITICGPTLLNMCQNSYCQMNFIANFMSLLCRCHCRYLHLL